jgi:nicotinate-nucleotide adenylyltransferase
MIYSSLSTPSFITNPFGAFLFGGGFTSVDHSFSEAILLFYYLRFMKVGLYFGSFNPIHLGHLILANYMVEATDLDQIWFVISPQSPHKKKASLLDEYQRLHLVELAIEGNDNFKTSNVEFSMPKPSYTADTLAVLSEKHPKHEFVLIMGSDNLKTFHKWKNFETILNYYEIYCYSRPDSLEGDLFNHPKVKLMDAPMMKISASHIRECIQKGQSVQYIVPEKCVEYLDSIGAYQ